MLRLRWNGPEGTRGSLRMQGNTFERIVVNQSDSWPNETSPIVSVREAQHIGIEMMNERYNGIKGYKVISVREAAIVKMEGCLF